MFCIILVLQPPPTAHLLLQKSETHSFFYNLQLFTALQKIIKNLYGWHKAGVDDYIFGQSRWRMNEEHCIKIIRRNVETFCSTVDQLHTINSSLRSFVDIKIFIA